MKRRSRAKAAAIPARPEPGGVWLGATPPVGFPNTHAILSQVLARVFTEIDLSASLTDGLTWYPLRISLNVSAFQMAHGNENRRYVYNTQCLERARRERKPVLGEHAGFHDIFAAIGDESSPWIFVTGPFAIARPKTSDVLSRWRELTGGHGHASDPEFLRYVSMTLGAATFEGTKLERFKRIVSCFVRLLGAEGDAAASSDEVSKIREDLADVRFVEQTWQAVREMLDESTAGGWHSPGRLRGLLHMGAHRLPQHVMVGLLMGGQQNDPVDDLLARDAFSRACVDVFRKRGGVLCGRVADHGVSFVVDDSASGARLRAQLSEIGEQAAQLAKSFGLKLHLGVGAESAHMLPGRYQSALAAAELALSRGESIVHAERGARAGRSPLGALRKQLTDAVGENAKLLSPRFDRYLEVLLVHCGHRLEPIRAHLESAFDQIVDALRATGAVEGKSLTDLQSGLERAVGNVATVRELATAYRAGIADIEVALQRPQAARQERSMRRAMEFVRDHLAEPLSVARVAKVAGFAPRYFSKIFSETEHETFHQYVLGLRLEHARRTLVWSTLSVERVGQLAGFPTRSHFHRAFVQAEGVTPLAYREKMRKSTARRSRKQR